MSYKFLVVLAFLLAFSSQKYENIFREERDLFIQKQSWKRLTLMEQKTDELKTPPKIAGDRERMVESNKTKSIVQQEHQHQNQQHNINLSLNDELILKSEITMCSGSFPLGTVLVLILIHICGANLVAAVSTVSPQIVSAASLIEIGFSSLAVYPMYKKWKCEKAEVVKNKLKLQNESLVKDQDHDDTLNTLTEVNTQLQNWRNQLKLKLEEVEQEKEENKKNLQAVEKKIAQKDLSSDKPEALLRDKEMLLWTQWKLDMIKKDTEIQLLNTEKLKEPIEFQVIRMRQKKEIDMQI